MKHSIRIVMLIVTLLAGAMFAFASPPGTDNRDGVSAFVPGAQDAAVSTSVDQTAVSVETAVFDATEQWVKPHVGKMILNARYANVLIAEERAGYRTVELKPKINTFVLGNTARHTRYKGFGHEHNARADV